VKITGPCQRSSSASLQTDVLKIEREALRRERGEGKHFAGHRAQIAERSGSESAGVQTSVVIAAETSCAARRRRTKEWTAPPRLHGHACTVINGLALKSALSQIGLRPRSDRD